MTTRKFILSLGLFYFLVAVLITYPLVLRMSSSIYSTPDRTIDALADIYNLWWQKEAPELNQSPNFYQLLGVTGIEIPRLPCFMMIIAGLGKWLTILTNEVFAFNFLILLSFPLAGVAMYALATHVTKNRWAAALAGFIFAFSPLHRHYSFEWLGHAQWHWLPLYVLALVKLDEKRNVTWGLLTGLLFSIVFMENYYFGCFAVFFTLTFVVFRAVQVWLVEKRLYLDRQLFLSYFLALLVVLGLTLPATSTFVSESRRLAAGEPGRFSGFVQDEWPRFAFSARPWYYIFPDVNHPVFGRYVKRIYDWIATKPPYFITKPFYPREHTLYLGWTVLALSAVAVFWAMRQRVNESTPKHSDVPSEATGRVCQRVWVFLFLGISMAVFSAPPYVTISLHKIYFPAHFLYESFPMFRGYARFGVLVLLCVSILAAFGIKIILEKLKSLRSRRIFLGVVFALIFFEFLNFPPFRSVSLEPLPVYKWIAEQPGDFAILVYPQDLSNHDLLAQRIHGKRFLNPKGWVSSEVHEVMEDLNTKETIEKLCVWNTRYLVLRYYKSLGLEKNYKLVKTYDSPRVYLFEVPCK